MEHTSNNKLFIGLLVLIVWLPLPLGSNQPWAWTIMEIWIIILTLGWLWQFTHGHTHLTRAFQKATPILVLWGLWLVYIGLQFIPLPYSWIQAFSPQAAHLHALTSQTSNLPGWATFSVDPYMTRIAFHKSVSYILLFCLTLLLINRRYRLRWLGYVIVLSGVLQAIYGTLSTLSGLEYGFFQQKTVGLGVATGTFVNRNHLAGYLEMCLAIGTGLLIAQLGDATTMTWRQWLRSLLDWILSEKMRLRLYLVMMVIALVLTHSRMGNTAFFLSLLIAGIMGLALSRRAPRSTIILLASLVIIDMLIIGAWFGIDKVAQRLEQTSLMTEVRDEVDISIIPYWQDYLWTGSGLNSFYTVFPHYREQYPLGFFDHAHNDYLEFGAETGIIGLFLLGSSVMLTLIVALLAQYCRHDPLYRGIAFGTVMGIIALLIHSSVDFNLQIPANAATFMVLLALAWITCFLPRTPTSLTANRKRS